MDYYPSLEIELSPEVEAALNQSQPVVALESAVITHGLPYPENLQLGLDVEAQVRQAGATPATIGVIDGIIHVGLERMHLERLAQTEGLHKISLRDFAPARVNRWSGGTTVAGTLLTAQRVGLRVFSTGGIGGVHRGAPFDISTDLFQLARSPLIVICAGAKAILDLPATLEVLETFGVPVVGFQTDEFPGFYCTSSGLPVSARVDTPKQAAELARAHWALGLQSAVLIVVPPPAEMAIEPQVIESLIQQAVAEAEVQGVRGASVTPFLLQRMNELSRGASLQANLALLRNNARTAASIAAAL